MLANDVIDLHEVLPTLLILRHSLVDFAELGCIRLELVIEHYALERHDHCRIGVSFTIILCASDAN